MIESIVIAVVIGCVVGLLCVLLGKVLGSLSIPPAAAVGGFLAEYGWAIGVLAALWAFFTGWRP